MSPGLLACHAAGGRHFLWQRHGKKGRTNRERQDKERTGTVGRKCQCCNPRNFPYQTLIALMTPEASLTFLNLTYKIMCKQCVMMAITSSKTSVTLFRKESLCCTIRIFHKCQEICSFVTKNSQNTLSLPAWRQQHLTVCSTKWSERLISHLGASDCVETYLSDSSTSVGVTSDFDQDTMALWACRVQV